MLGLIEVLIGGIIQGGVYAAIALGFSLVFRVTGVVNLSQGAFSVLGAMGMYFCQVKFGIPLAVSVIIAVLGTALFAAIVGATTFVPAVFRLPVSNTLMLTAGLLTFFEGVTLVVWGNQPYALPTFSGEAPILFAGVRIPTQGLWLSAGSLAIIVSLWWLLNRTRMGQALLALAENPVAARLMGINVGRMMVLAFALAAGIGALTGVLFAPVAAIQFDSGRMLSTSGFIAVAIGGMGTFGGAVVGGLVLGIASQLAAFYVSSLFATSLSLGLLIVVLIWRPAGLFRAGAVQRVDVRVNSIIHRALVRLPGHAAVALGGFLLLFFGSLPLLPLPPGVMSSLAISMIIFLAVLGLDVLMGYTGQVSLGQAGFMAIGAYAAAILATTHDWPPLLATFAAMGLSLVCAFALSLVTGRLRGHYLALATLTFGLLVDSLTVGLIDLTGGPSGLVGIPSFAIGSFEFDSSEQMYYLALGVAAVVIVLLEGGMRSSFGRSLQAVRTDQLAAAALGVNVPAVKLAALCISSALASLAGSLYAFQFHFLSPEMVSTPRSFEFISMLVLGGEGTLIGGLLGALFLTMLPTMVQSLAVYKTIVSGLLLVGAILLLPEGLFGRMALFVARRWTSDVKGKE